MGLEYPYLAIIYSAAFILLVTSMISVTVWINYQMSRTPVLEAYSEFNWVNTNNSIIKITIRETRGDPVNLEQVLLPTDDGLVTINGPGTYSIGNSTIKVSYTSFKGTLYPGQEGVVNIEVTNATQIYTSGKTYRAGLLFKGGTMTVTFIPP